MTTDGRVSDRIIAPSIQHVELKHMVCSASASTESISALPVQSLRAALRVQG